MEESHKIKGIMDLVYPDYPPSSVLSLYFGFALNQSFGTSKTSW